MADFNSGGDRKKALINSVISYLEQVDKDPEFKDTFLAVINGAGDTCGDRMALSVVNLSIAHQIQTNDLSDTKSLANLLSRGIWVMETLEGIAGEKVKSLPLVDEVEVYLGYPTMLKDRLELPINIGEMLYFHCSRITEDDLDAAEEIVNDQLNNQDSLKDFLISQDKWIEALEKNYPQEMEELEKAKELAMDGEDPDYVGIDVAYKQGVLDLTSKAVV
jgi:hypothetical protein